MCSSLLNPAWIFYLLACAYFEELDCTNLKDQHQESALSTPAYDTPCECGPLVGKRHILPPFFLYCCRLFHADLATCMTFFGILLIHNSPWRSGDSFFDFRFGLFGLGLGLDLVVNSSINASLSVCSLALAPPMWLNRLAVGSSRFLMTFQSGSPLLFHRYVSGYSPSMPAGWQ